MADLSILRDAAGAYCASMTPEEWEAFAASVREPIDADTAPSDPEAKKARATAAFRRAGGGTTA
ncbi:hypothetical protein AB0F65_17625 [Nocardia rhamnosiphila]|uniref:hypothetical protein n=1 Tax=Nocardia rhamnosiphila TaxID=426716 RepID=UPI00340ABA27